MNPIISRIPLDSKKCKNFRSMFGLPQGIVRNVKRQASVFDTINWMQRTKIPSELSQTKQYAKSLVKNGGSLKKFTIRIWNDLFGCTRYKFDELGKEQVRSPQRLVHDREGDCDCFVSFMSSVLLNLNIDHLLRMTAYEDDWQHIYIIVPKRKGLILDTKNPKRDVLRRDEYIVLDPVIEVYDKEKPYSKKYDALMSSTTLQSLAGIHIQAPTLAPCSCTQTLKGLEELGFLKKLFDKIGDTKVGKVFKDTRDAVKKGVGTVAKTLNRFANPLAILLRNGILLGMKINMFKLGAKLRWGYLSDAELRIRGWQQSNIDKLRKGLTKLEKIHEGAGGKKSNLRSAILKGKGNKDNQLPSNLRGLGNLDDDDYTDPLSFLISKKPIEELENEILLTDNGLGEVATGAALAAAASILAAIAKIVSSIVPPKGQDAEQWDTTSQFPSEQLNDPYLDQIINNPEGFDMERALAASENFSQENLDTQKRNIVADKKDNTVLIVGGTAILLFGLWAFNNKTKPPTGNAPALAGTKKRKRKTKGKTRTRAKPKTKAKTRKKPRKTSLQGHQSLARITL